MIYIASPFFTDEQNQEVSRVEKLLLSYGMKFFSPRQHGGILKDMTPERRTLAAPSVFQSNVSGISRSGLVLAITDHRDTGTIWEMGYAHGYGVPVVTLSVSGRPTNVMLAQCVEAHFTTYEHLEGLIQIAKLGMNEHDRDRPAAWKDMLRLRYSRYAKQEVNT